MEDRLSPWRRKKYRSAPPPEIHIVHLESISNDVDVPEIKEMVAK